MADTVLQGADPSGPTGRAGTASSLLSRVAAALGRIRLGRCHFWLATAMVAAGAALHYADPLLALEVDGPIPLAATSMHRILFVVPVAYAGFIFGPRGGFAALAAVIPIMLPRALLISRNPSHSLLEVFCVAMVSGLIILWFNGQQREKAHRLEILSRLEVARQELATQVEIIRKNEKRLAAINEVCCVVGQSMELPRLFELILDRVVREMGVAVAMIFLKDRQGRILELAAHKGLSEDVARAVAPLRVGEGFNGRVAESGEAMVVEDSSRDPRLAVPEVVRDGIRSQMIVPLQSKGTTIGTLCVAARANRVFSGDEMELLTAIGSQVGIAIENARLYQEALTSEEKYRDLFENATVAIFVQDMEGGITAANKAFSNLTGYSLEESRELNVADFFPSSALETLSRVQQELVRGKGESQPYDVRMIRKDGAESILSMSTRLVSENGQPRGFQHIAIDITERRKMRDTLNYYMWRLISAQEEERKRIARELHDETAQSLLLILQRIDGITYVPGREFSDRVEKELEELRAVVLQALAGLRRITRDLRPQILDDLGLVAAIEWLAEEMERQSGIKTTVELIGPQRSLTPESQLLLFRITQEAFSNIRRHSGARAARAVLEFVDGWVRMTIEDNGRGFRAPASLSDLANDGKLGIVGMHERARLVGGCITLQTEPGKGTRIVAELPG